MVVVARFCFGEAWVVERGDGGHCVRSCFVWNGGDCVGVVCGL
jgi:hypothetical protein